MSKIKLCPSAILAITAFGIAACSDGKPAQVEATGDTVEVVVETQVDDATQKTVNVGQTERQTADSVAETQPDKSVSDSIADLSRQVKESFKIEN